MLTCILQKRSPTCRYPERQQHGNLAEYCYEIEVEVTSNSTLTKVKTAENIAMVLSALMNSGGGVLVTHIITKTGDIHLDTCHRDIVRLITKQEQWVPEDVFTDTINCTKSESKNEIYFFVSRTKQLVSHNSNAKYFKERKPVYIATNDVLVGKVGACSCENDTRCEKHKDVATKTQIFSKLPSMNTLNAHQLFPLPESVSDTNLFRNYQLNDRCLAEVLKTKSAQCEILELVSALANTNGGSIFLGITNMATPTVKGYRLGENDTKSTEDCISDILTGRKPGPATIWGNPYIQSTHYWKIFFHKVLGDDSERKVIEIRVKTCPGGMFCALPVCLDIRHSGEIYHLDSFAEWKKRLCQRTTKSGNVEESEDYHKHFENKGMTDQDISHDLTIQPAGTSIVEKTPRQTKSFPEFCWWLSDDGVVAESLQFDQCCSKELADSEMDIFTKFSTFPSLETVIERHANIKHLEDTLKELLHAYQSHNGVVVFIENLSDATLPIYATLKDITPTNHVFDFVVLKQECPPVIVSIFKQKCPKEEAKRYCLTLGQLLKRHCSYAMCLEKGSMKLFFHCQLCFLGEDYEQLQDKKYYPKDYIFPSIHTVDTVRYTLARILLDCQPYITDRYGNIMVKHLSSCQAKILLGRRSKVMIVASKAGSGKTVLALEMARRIKKQDGTRIAFFCRSRGLVAFVKSQTKGTEIFETVQECNIQSFAKLNTHLFKQYTDIIIDDAHAIPVQGEPTTWKMYNDLFSSLRTRKAHAYIFLDPDMQDYRECIPEDFISQLRTLAGQYVTEYEVTIQRLGKSLRNSSRICQFTKACMATGSVDELSTVRQIPEDGVFFYSIQGRDAEQGENVTLLSRLSDILKVKKRYQRRDIAILTDNHEDKTWIKEMLKGNYGTTEATHFPVKHVVVDTLENFEGLESPVILFVIPESWGTGYVGTLKYRLCVVTRAISRLEFLLPWDPSNRQQDIEELKRAFSLQVNRCVVCLILLVGI